MRFVFAIPTALNITVDNVNSAEHAVNRLKKYLEENVFEVGALPPLTYNPGGEIMMDFNEFDVAKDVSLETIVNPPHWFSQMEQQAILCALEEDDRINEHTFSKVMSMFEEGR